MTRLVQLCCDPGISYGASKGAAVHLGELGRALAEDGADVLTVVSRTEPAPPVHPGVGVAVLPGPGRCARARESLAADARRAEWLAARLVSWRADVVYERVSLHTTAGLDAARAAGVPLIVELNAPLPAEAARYRTIDEPDLADALERRVLAGADCVLAVSRPLAAYAAARGARRIEVCPNGVDPRRFPQPAAAGGAPPVAVLAGSLRPWHGADVVAAAWALLGPGAPRLLVVGDGTGRQRLEAAGATVTGMVEPSRVPALLGGAQIGLAPYPADAPDYFSPLKLFEYLAAGLAVVAGDLPGVADVAGDVAVLVPPGDPAAFAAAVAALAADPQRRARLGAAGRERARADHSWSRRAGRVLALAAELRSATAER